MITENIMVVDDDQDLRESVVEILEDNGYTVIAWETAESALEKMADTVPRLVL